LLGNGAGGFTLTSTLSTLETGTQPTSVVLADFNADGKLDLAVTPQDSSNVRVLMGNGSGGFDAASSFPTGIFPSFVATADFDVDGKLDLIVSTIVSDNVSILRGDGTGKFSVAGSYGTGAKPSIAALGDFNQDGKPDFALAHSNAGIVTVFVSTNCQSTFGTNQLDISKVFVRQHYLDFLNREPDSGGLGFWINEITSCGSDPQCIEVKRINVSAAFFLSIEFQETGYLVYRLYKSGFGNLPSAPVPVRLTEFLRDTQRIGQGVQVGIGDWQAQLEANKQAYALAFVQRPEFLIAYPNSLTATQVVTQMNTNSGGVLTGTDQANLIALLGATPSDTSKRAAVLRAVADNANLRAAEFNKAFVLMQYFGYLRRNPNDAPDADYSGFNFWLNKLNQFGGNFVNAEMVKAFIISGEYRQRFGP
jgi:hypothetical protein